MCKCKNIVPQSKECYAQMVTLKVPQGSNILMNAPSREKKKLVCVDPCLADEIKHLWKLGIVTTGCCCGHNKMEAYIGVKNEFISTMKSMGYRVHFNPCRPNDEDSFIPKTELIN